MLEQKIRSLIFVFSTDCLALKLNEIFLSVKILTIRPKNKMVKYIIESVVLLIPPCIPLSQLILVWFQEKYSVNL